MPRSLDNPTLAEAFDQLRADYDMAKESRFRRRRAGVTGIGRSADYHLRSEYDLARCWELARDFERNDLVISPAVRRVVTNVVQDGITPDAQTPDEGLNDELEARWTTWADDPRQCDIQAKRSFNELEKAVCRAMIVEGDICALPLREGSLEMIECQRLRTATNTRRNVVHGVELSPQRRPLSYWFTQDELDPFSAVSRVADMRIVPAWDEVGEWQVFHCYRCTATRISQSRGTSAMAAICDTAAMLADTSFAKLVQAKVVSCYALIEELPEAWRGQGRPETTGARGTETLPDGTSLDTMGISPGMRIRSRPGAKLTGFSPNVPNPEFIPYSMFLLMLISINLDLPLTTLLMKPEGSFSSYRGAVTDARIGFRGWQNNLVGQFHRPAWRWKLRQWAAQDPILAAAKEKHGEAFFKVRWNPPRWAYIEPLTDAGADLLRMRNGMGAPSMVLAERGLQWPHVIGSTVKDNALAIRLAKAEAAEINKEYPDETPVSWRELLALPTPDRVSVSFTAPVGGEAQQKGEGGTGKGESSNVQNGETAP